MEVIKLNLGCGYKRITGFVNVDKEPLTKPDVLWDLEKFPWPWKDNSVNEVKLVHVLEHLGRETSVYKNIIQELYRVCINGAAIEIRVPYFRHTFYWADPTHVRAITPFGMALLSQSKNKEWIAAGYANTTLGLFWNVDFEVANVHWIVDKRVWDDMFPHMTLSENEMQEFLGHRGVEINELVSEVHIGLTVIKTNV